METLTYENLIDAGACDEAELFALVYPNGLPLTAESIEAALMRFPGREDWILARLPREIARALTDAIQTRVENMRRRVIAVVLADSAQEILMALPNDRRDNPHAEDHSTYDQRLADLPRDFASAIGIDGGITPEDIRRSAGILDLSPEEAQRLSLSPADYYRRANAELENARRAAMAADRAPMAGREAAITPEHLEAARRRLSEPDPEDPSLLVNIFGREAMPIIERQQRAPTAHRPRAGARHFIEQLRAVNLTPAEATELHVAIEARVRPLRGNDYPPARSGTGAVQFSPQFSARELSILMEVIDERQRSANPLTGS